MERARQNHSFAPVFDENSRVLVLGTFPSVKSREFGFYYGHPQNRFWKVCAAVFGCAVPETIEQKQAMLLAHGVALWDTVQSCEIIGSSDASIRAAEPTELSRIFNACRIEKVVVNGKTAEHMFRRYQTLPEGCLLLTMPSTSPANAAWSTERLAEAWRGALLPEADKA